MQCTRCGRDVRVGSSFCPHCGEPAAQAYDATTTTGPPPGADPYDSQLTTEIPSPFSRDAAAREPEPQPERPDRPAPRSVPPTAPVVGGPPPEPHWDAPAAPPEPGQPGQAPAWDYAAPPPPAPQGPPAPHTQPGQVPSASPRTFAEVMAGFTTGLLGGVVVAAFAVLQVLGGLVTALNDDTFSKTAFLLLGLVVVAVTVVATVAIWGRTRVRHRTPDSLETLSLGAGLFASVYGVLVLLTVALSDQGQALQLVR